MSRRQWLKATTLGADKEKVNHICDILNDPRLQAATAEPIVHQDILVALN